MNQPLQTASIAQDVRKLIKQVEGGNAFDTEFTGHAFDVQEQALDAIRARLGVNDLGDDVSARLERFARDCASAQVYLRLVITDEMPQLTEYDPCHVSVYDGINEAGVDFSKVIQRSTIYGTVMTSVNMTDLRAYFESGRKRHLLLYLGSDRNVDMKALDKMLAALPAILAAAGLDADTIKQIIAAMKAGNLPPALMKIVQMAIRMADLKALPSTPQTRTQITRLQKEFAAIVTRAALALAGIAPVLEKMVTALKTRVAEAPRLPIKPAVLPQRQTIRANNDNRVEPVISTRERAVKTQKTAVIATAQKTHSSTPGISSPVQTHLRQAAKIIVAAATETLVPVLEKIISPIARIGTVAQTTKSATKAQVLQDNAKQTARPLISKIVESKQTISQSIAVDRVAAASVPVSVTTPPARSSSTAMSVANKVEPVNTTAQKLATLVEKQLTHKAAEPKTEKSGVLRNPDGSVRDCCLPQFKKAAEGAQTAALEKIARTAPAEAPTITQDDQGNLVIKTKTGETRVSAKEAAEDARNHERLTDQLEQARAIGAISASVITKPLSNKLLALKKIKAAKATSQTSLNPV